VAFECEIKSVADNGDGTKRKIDAGVAQHAKDCAFAGPHAVSIVDHHSGRDHRDGVTHSGDKPKDGIPPNGDAKHPKPGVERIRPTIIFIKPVRHISAAR